MHIFYALFLCVFISVIRHCLFRIISLFFSNFFLFFFENFTNVCNVPWLYIFHNFWLQLPLSTSLYHSYFSQLHVFFFNSVRVHCVLMCVCVFVCLFIHVCVCTRVRVHVSVFVCVVPHWDMGNLLMTIHPKRKVAYSLSSHQTKI